jgi:hypothetical protein
VTDTERDPLVDALWARVLEAWDDDKPHQALLEYAIREQKLPTVAGLYRGLKDSNPERAARAQKKLDGIVIAVTQMLMAMKTPNEKPGVPRSLTVTVGAVTTVILLWVVYVILRRH